MSSIYGEYEAVLPGVMNGLMSRLESRNEDYAREHGENLYDHLSGRIKSDGSMREKLRRRGLEETAAKEREAMERQHAEERERAEAETQSIFLSFQSASISPTPFEE